MAFLIVKLKQSAAHIYHYLQRQGITYWLKWSLYTLILIEIFQRIALTSWAGWFFHQPVASFINYLMVLSILLLCYGLLGNRRAATLLAFGGLSLIAFSDAVKFLYMQEHLYPLDFLIIPEILSLLPSLSGAVWVATVFILLVMPILLYGIIKQIKHADTSLLKRVLMITCSLFFLGSMTTVIEVPSVQSYLSHRDKKTNHYRNYKKNGFLMAFAMNIAPLIHIEKPTTYSATDIQKITDQLIPTRPGESAAVKPNVIVVMSESLFDPTQLPVTYSKDPLKNLHALQAVHGKSSLISPGYAGMTCNVEFEVLTGFSLGFFPAGTLPYQHYVKNPLPALPHIFKKNGYETLAIHSYRKNFFRRESIYPLLGFDNFISVEDFDNPIYIGNYVSDQEISQKIIATADAMEGPYFIFAVTMQNHLPFSTPADTDVDIQGPLSPDTKALLARYSAGVRDADEHLRVLIQHFEQSPRPTIIVFFGDHLPGLQPVFEETHFLDNPTAALKKHTVPALLWSNYKQIPPLENMSTFYIGGYILEQAGLPSPGHFALLETLRNEYPIVSYNMTIDKNHVAHDTHTLKHVNTADQHLLHDYWLMQHDQIFGERYLLGSVPKATDPAINR